MMNFSSGNNFQTKQESGGTNDNSKLSKTRRSPSSSRQWGGFKNPRIVRVSRTFGGKDRHSKVCTIRGLRDRRIRLSVPTAIQLYDLQDRLGLSQPSKVVDWLLESTKNEIDKLPPLPIPPGYFTRFQQPPQESVHDLQQLRSHELFNENSSYLKDKIGDFDAGSGASRKNKSIASNDQEENQEDNNVGNRSPNLAGMPFNSYYQWEPNSNLSLAQFGQNSFSSQIEESQNDLPLSLASASQLYFNPIATAPYITNETDLRQLNHFNFLSSTSQYILPNPIFPTTLSLISSPMKPFSLNDGPGWIHSRDHDDDDNQPHEGGAN